MKEISNRDFETLKRSLPLVLSALAEESAKSTKVANAARQLKLIAKKLK